MAVAGIISEYNPFHLGHGYQIEETRRVMGHDTAVVCVMSGNFVQRGDCAVVDKWSRARCALLGGADLVLELPTAWATASAERFAQGGVAVLAATGVVDTLSFGSEGGDVEELRAAAQCLNAPEYGARLKEALAGGISFPTAREKAARALIGEAAGCLSTPNNNLAVEYLRHLPPGINAMTVRRVGADHDAAAVEGYASASAIRTLLLGGELAAAEQYLPDSTAEVLRQAVAEGRSPASLQHCRRAMLARLRTMSDADFAALPDSGAAEGLPVRLVGAARSALTPEEFCDRAKTKRYTHARLRRLALWAFLGLTAAERPEHVPYLRVLGMNGRGKELLGQMKQTATLPIITKAAHANKLRGAAGDLLRREAGYTDLYALCTPEIQPCGLEYTTGPVMI